ncbi:MAG: ROK family transcriptional regulator [Lentisphaeria bacterium]|nr:ROK family transcriptional regulator [Lentisphaeria bacterium]
MKLKLTGSELDALKCVWTGEAESRIDIARILKMSRPTASVLVKSLIDNHFLTEDGCRRSFGGKPAIKLKIRPDSFHSIGIDIGYENLVRAISLDAAGNIIKQIELAADSGYNDRLNAVREAVKALRTDKTCGVGIAVSGMVNPQGSKIIHSANFELTDKPIARITQDSTGLPVYIDNRARMAARAELFYGSAQGITDFLLVSLGKGIGSAITISGKIYSGVSGKAGEVRNFNVPDYSGKSMTTWEKALQEDTLEQQDYPCRKMAEICASGFNQVLSLIDLDVVVLSGRFCLFPDTFREELHNLMPDIRFKLSHFGRDSGACGSAIAATEHAVFNKP